MEIVFSLVTEYDFSFCKIWIDGYRRGSLFLLFIMKLFLSSCLVFIFGIANIFAYDPAPTDFTILQQVYTLMEQEEQESLNIIKDFLVDKQDAFDEDSKKYRLAEQLIKHIEQIWAWRSLAATYADHWPEILEQQVESGDTIQVDYIWSLIDGSVFDTSLEQAARDAWLYNAQRPYQPLEFTVWAGQMIAWFDAGVVGMRLGETQTLTIPPEDAYGFGHHFLAGDTLVFEVTIVEIQ